VNRRQWLADAAGWVVAAAAAPVAARSTAPPPWPRIEQAAGGLLGVAVLDGHDGRLLSGHRLDERFPMCSTFKWLLAAAVLQRVDAGEETLERRLRFGRDALLPYAPVTSPHAGGDGMAIAELCEAAVAWSDNTAANLLLGTLGGPEGVTRCARSLGDRATRLDRWEPQLNEASPGDPRDTTTPRAMATTLRAAVLGDALSEASRGRLAQWLRDCRTNGHRLGAHVPAGWRLGSKTGTGARGTTNDVGIFWPPGRPPVVVAVYLTQTTASEAVRNGTVAAVAKGVTGGV